ncbi:hypothetical protein J4212_01015 [Candidatus Woesearchaeota archaeon]|nr:hypothetical protein [Candidatus Woesearchaeota archaeon]
MKILKSRKAFEMTMQEVIGWVIVLLLLGFAILWMAGQRALISKIFGSAF